MTLTRISAVLLLVILIFAPRSAWADDPPTDDMRARFAELKKQGDDAMDEHHYDEAIAAFTRAYELIADPAVLYNKGRAHEARAEYPEALEALLKFEADAPPELKAKVPKLAELVGGLRARVAVLTVRCNVPGARVTLNDRLLGATPLEGRKLAAEKGAIIEVSAEGYYPFKGPVDLIGGGAPAVLGVELKTKATSGILAVVAPAGSHVIVDGRPWGTAPLVERVVDTGPHAVRVLRDGYDDAEASAVVTPGERKEFRVDLVKKPPLYAKWWFWSGIGVVVLGGVAVVYAVTKERSPDSGDRFAPDKVAAPLMRF
jgi:hypothetical protein